MDTSIKHGILEGTNEGSTAYICVLCGKGQSSLDDLEKHMMNHNRTSQTLENSESPTNYSQTEIEKDENAENLCASLQTKNYDKENIGVCNIMKRYGTKSESKVLQENFKNNRMLGLYSSTKKKWVEENLKENVKGHTSIHYCTVCNKGFTEKRNLMYHYRTHQEEKQYKCEYCGKGFHFNFNLKKHIRIHTGETPYSCGVCQRGFRHKNSLNRHMLLHLDNNHLGNNHLDNNHLDNNHLGNNHVDNNQCDNKELANKHGLQKCNISENSENWSAKTEKENIPGLNSSSVCGVCLKVFNKRRGLSMHVYRQYKNVESAFCKFCDREINGGVVVHLMSHSFNTTEALKGVRVSSEQKSTLPDHNKTDIIYSKTKMPLEEVPSPLRRQSSKVGNQHGHKSVKHKNGESRNSVEFTEQELCEKLKKQEDNKQQTTGSVNTVLKEQKMYSTCTNVPIIQTSKTVKTEIVTDGRYDMAVEFGGKTLQEGIKDHSLNKENTSSQSVLHQRDVTMPAVECRSTNDVFDPVQFVMETKGQILGSQTIQDNIKIEESLHSNDTRLSIDSVVSSNTGVAKIFKCPVCDRSFRFNSYLKSHMKVHSGEKPHTCPVCNKGFTHKFNLTKHLRTHTGETPYMCKLCGRQFSQKNSLNRHMLLHTENSLYTCYLCGLKLCDKTTFEYHLLSHDQLGYNQIGGNKSIGEMSEMLKSGNSTSSTLCQKLSLGQRDSVLLKNNNSQMSGDVVSDKDLLNEYQGHQIASGPKTKKSVMEYPIYASDKQGQRNTTVPKIVNSLIDYPISAFDKQSFSKKTTSLDYDKKVSFSGENGVREENKTVVFDVHHRDKNSNSNYYGQDFGMVSGQSEPLNLSLKRETRMDLDSNVTVYSGILNSFGKGSNQVDCHLKISSKHRIENIQESSFTDKVMKTMHNMMSDKFAKKPFNLQRKIFREKIGCNCNPCNISRPLTRIDARQCSPASQYFKRHKKSRKLSSPKNQQLKKKKSEYKLKIQSTQVKRVVFKCKYCFGTFNNGISLKYHNFDHLKEENFKCDQCKQTFRLFISLNIHIIAHHAN